MESQLRPTHLLPPDHIVLDLDCGSKKRVFEHIALLFENNVGVARRNVFESLIARERLGSTVIGKGTAIPHGRMENIRQPVAAFVRLRQPVVFETMDDNPVKNLFVILSPESPSPAHLRACAMFTRMLGDEDLMGGLERSADSRAAFGLIEDWEARHLNEASYEPLESAAG